MDGGIIAEFFGVGVAVCYDFPRLPLPFCIPRPKNIIAMPTIYDNIEKNLLDGLREGLADNPIRADICVGYFNLRGWAGIADAIDSLPNENGPACRLIVGMTETYEHINRSIQRLYGGMEEEKATNQIAVSRKERFIKSLVRQLAYGIPTGHHAAALKKLARQLRDRRLVVNFFAAYRLHAKLYLVHRENKLSPVVGFVGSSNLTLAGLKNQGELNVDVLDRDAAEKLSRWFEQRWEDQWCQDITDELADIIENGWPGGPISPYEIYIKTAYELSREAIEGSREFRVPKQFQKIMPEFQQKAVSLAAERLNHPNGGVLIGDVVGLGKTLVASAVAKTFQQDQGNSVLVICPPNLREMWENYLHEYQILGETLSLGATKELQRTRRHKLVIIDESHNLRNRESARHAQVRDYIRDNDSRVILLSATPYNKSFEDIGSQLRLFIDPDTDLGAKPETCIKATGGVNGFAQEHPNTLVSSLSAFEKSSEIDDWRELMRKFMVRRTRSHIKKNYAEYDEERKQRYIVFGDGRRFYFPDRVAKCARFELNEGDEQDQYAALYSEEVVDTITDLNLPRYGLRGYLRNEYSGNSPHAPLSAEEQRVIRNLSRAGKQLRGFAKSSLFKRLESSGPAFLLSVRRHIVRNAVYLSAMEREDGKFPIGGTFAALIDENLEEVEEELFDAPDNTDLKRLLNVGAQVYDTLRGPKLQDKFDWITVKAFRDDLAEDLLEDCKVLLENVLGVVSDWSPAADRKLQALAELCKTTHGKDKILVFTQFKDTADYLHSEFKKRGISRTAMVHGGMQQSILPVIKRFSPRSNGCTKEEAARIDQLRILITTDTLSEGQNLQDAHVVVNFDLPWAIIRLIQRVGRVDRIGQDESIHCYCFLPAEGIERIINLRGRLHHRLEANAELIGSDERFFEGDRVNLIDAFEGKLSLEEEDETDLISRCYAIWLQATKNNPSLKRKIESLPDVVYSAKRSPESGVLAYIKTTHQQHILVQMNEQGEVASQSQFKILDLLACEPHEPQAPVAENHFDLLKCAVDHARSDEAHGALGGTRSIRRRVYSHIVVYLERHKNTLFESTAMLSDLGKAGELILKWPLKEAAGDRLGRQLRAGIEENNLAAMVHKMWESGDLCAVPKENEPAEPRIICSLGLHKQ